MDFDALDNIFTERVSEISLEEVQIEDAPETIDQWHKRVLDEYDYLFTIGMDFDITVRNDLQMCRRIKKKYKYGIFELTNYMRMLQYLGDVSEVKISMNVNCNPRNRGGILECDKWSPKMMGEVDNMMYLNIAFSPRTPSATWLAYIAFITDLAKRRKKDVVADIFGKTMSNQPSKYNVIQEIRLSDIRWNTIKTSYMPELENTITAINIILTNKLKFNKSTSYDIASKVVKKISNGTVSIENVSFNLKTKLKNGFA